MIETRSGVHLLPADITLARGETELLSKVGNFYILKERLEPVRQKFRHVLIDCPPSLGLLTINGLAAADQVLIPVQCQFFALKGLESLRETIQSVQRRLNPNLKILGVLPTMAESKTVMTQDVLSALQKRLGDIKIFDPVPKSIKFAESNLAGEPIHQYAGYSKLVQPYEAIAGGSTLMMFLGLLVESLAPSSSIRLVEILEIWAGKASRYFWSLDYLRGHCYNPLR